MSGEAGVHPAIDRNFWQFLAFITISGTKEGLDP